jgi:hypothetical protein
MGTFPTHSISPALFDDREILDDNARRASPCATALCLHAATFARARCLALERSPGPWLPPSRVSRSPPDSRIIDPTLFHGDLSSRSRLAVSNADDAARHERQRSWNP